MILVSTLLCDRKKHFQTTALETHKQLTYQDCISYFNIETENPDANFSELLGKSLPDSGLQYHVDIWQMVSTWCPKPQFDQDQARLVPIVTARNMTIAAATCLGVSHIFQVDADVIVPPDSIERLLALNHPICGGMVPGRGDHRHVFYQSGDTPTMISDDVIEVAHGTCGFMLISRDVFTRLRYRTGPSNLSPGVWLSEDPAFTEDTNFLLKMGKMRLDRRLTAQHLDDVTMPFKSSQF